MALPFLPGNTFADHNKAKFHVSQTLSYKNGYPVTRPPLIGVSGDPLQTSPSKQISEQDLEELAHVKPNLTYTDPTHQPTVQFIPAHVAFDKKVLHFDAYFKQIVHESALENYRIRFVKIYYYLEDDSISVVEPVIENSGIPQGKLIKRQRLPKDDQGDTWHWKDLNVGIDVIFYGTNFHIFRCNHFTANFMESEGLDVNPPEDCPIDPYSETRCPPEYVYQAPDAFDRLKQFIEMDRKVLRFWCLWDDRESMYGEKRRFILHYYLVDDTIEVLEERQTNDGRDPYPVFLRRQRLPKDSTIMPETFPKVVLEVTDHEIEKWYSPADLAIGNTTVVLGRKFLLYDADQFTRKYLMDHFKSTNLESVQIESEEPSLIRLNLPPYNGFGDLEDSLQNCLSLVPQPPKKDFIKMLENDGKVLRFSGSMVSKFPEDKNRKFIIAYRISDDMFTIYEPPQRNAGIIGGKFLERTRIKKPHCDPSNPEFYGPQDIIVGKTIDVFSHTFLIENADEFVLKYMEERPDQFSEEIISALKKVRGKGYNGVDA